MPVTVNVNRLSLCHKGSDGITVATAPDVCKTPPGSIPVPYPNTAFSLDLANGSSTVFADGGNSIAHRLSIFSKSIGDEPGIEGGVTSGTYMKEASWITFSADVRVEGQNACRLTDKMWHNHENTFNCAGEQQPPVKGGDLDCEAMWREVEKEVDNVLANGGDADPITRNQAITKAYARMYTENPELKWAGMGAFVSRNVGCHMKGAKDKFDNLIQSPTDLLAKSAFRGLANGNKKIFKDIYSQLLFYSKFGNEVFQKCVDACQVPHDLKDAFNLFDQGRKLLDQGREPWRGVPFLTPQQSIEQAQQRIEKATLLVAKQEQAGTLEKLMQDAFFFNLTLRANSVASGNPIGRFLGAKKQDVFLSSSCDHGPKVPFNGAMVEKDDRLSMAKGISRAFDQLKERYPGWFREEMHYLTGGTALTNPQSPEPEPADGSIWPR
jgi:hypothetical protein